jgi:transcriptional regulator with XRE-family HTH domain
MSGRPTKYDKQFDSMAYELCKHGFTIEELAEHFNVSSRTISHWMRNQESFRNAIFKGRTQWVVKKYDS